MKFHHIVLVATFVLNILSFNIVHAQGGLDPSRKPVSDWGSMSEEAWEIYEENRGKDYISEPLQGGGGNGISSASGSSECKGYTTSEPDDHIYWIRNDIRESKRLRIFFVGKDDSTLAIRQPDGTWLCNDDSHGTDHPTINIEHPRTGDYYIWIGSKQSGNTITGDLFVTLENYTPSNYPLASAGWVYQGRGAGGGKATIMYVGADSQSRRLDLSIDIEFNGMAGDEAVRVAAWPKESSSNQFIRHPSRNSSYADDDGYVFDAEEFEPQFGSSSYDYSDNGRDNGPIELSIPDNELPSNTGGYYVIVRIQIQNSRGNWETVDEYRSSVIHTP
ncbi:MAG TPA: hypothetical protein VHO84_09125 [Syntrophorhabdaceae bacterium]|nr:hypothetical protein [Syntrophorhabdaceae bacterium]